MSVKHFRCPKCKLLFACESGGKELCACNTEMKEITEKQYLHLSGLARKKAINKIKEVITCNCKYEN